MPHRVVLSLLAVSLVAGAGQPSGDFVIRNARIFDGSGILESATVVVKEGKIASVSQDPSAPSGLPVVDGAGETLLPGLIDSHTHAFGDALRQALESGVTTELDMFTDWRYAQQTKKQQAEGKDTDLAGLRSAGTLATALKGHGSGYNTAAGESPL